MQTPIKNRGAVFCLLTVIMIWSCNKSDGGGGGGSSAPVGTPEPAVDSSEPESTTPPVSSTLPGTGTVMIQLEPKEGAPASSIAGASIAIDGNPEITTTTDESGIGQIANLSPGTVGLIITSAPDGAGLTTAASATYGLKISDIAVKSGAVNDLGKKPLKETGKITGKVVFYSNPNNLDLTGSDVFIPGTSFIAKTDANGTFILSGVPEGSYNLRLQHTGFAVFDRDEVAVQEAQTTDIGDIALSLSKGPEGSITVTESMKATIGGNANTKIVKSWTVNYGLNYDADAALMKVSHEPSFLNQTWKPVSPSGQLEFDGDGAKSIYVMYSDLNGLESSPYSADFFIDTEIPVISSVELLYGWGEVAEQAGNGASVPMSIVATDSGSGIETMRWGTNADLAGATWQPFSTEITDVALTSGLGSKRIYVQVRDYAGNVSAIASDTITLGTQSLIAKRTYTRPMQLVKELNPYHINDAVVFDSDFTIGQGVILTLGAAPASLDVKGTFTAIGGATAPTRISISTPTISGSCPYTAMGKLVLKNALPGVSENNAITRVDFDKVTIQLNGGDVTENTFKSTSCTSGGGYIEKHGRDKLAVKNNVYDKWDTAISVLEGTSITTFEGNSGTIMTAIRHSNGVSGTVYKDNSFTIYADPGVGAVYMEGGSLTMVGGTIDGNGILTNLIYAVADSTVNGIRANSCESIAVIAATADVNVTNARISDCQIMARQSGDLAGTVSVDYSEIAYTKALLIRDALDIPMDQPMPELTIKRSNITCSTAAAGFCEFTLNINRTTNAAVSLTLDSNNITCTDASKCRGFTFQAGAAASVTGNVTLDLINNYWTGKVPAADLTASDIVDSTNMGDYTSRNDAGLVKIYTFHDMGAFSTLSVLPVSLTPQAVSAITTAGPQAGF